MKIAICCSITSAKKVMEIKTDLEKLGHEVVLPHNLHLYASGEKRAETRQESTKNKAKDDLIRQFYSEIKDSDAVLAVNLTKNGVENYIGPNTFLEIGFAHVLNKKIFLLNPVPDMPIADEILAIKHTVINGDLSKAN